MQQGSEIFIQDAIDKRFAEMVLGIINEYMFLSMDVNRDQRGSSINERKAELGTAFKIMQVTGRNQTMCREFYLLQQNI